VIYLDPSKNLIALSPHLVLPSYGLHTELIVSGISCIDFIVMVWVWSFALALTSVFDKKGVLGAVAN